MRYLRPLFEFLPAPDFQEVVDKRQTRRELGSLSWDRTDFAALMKMLLSEPLAGVQDHKKKKKEY